MPDIQQIIQMLQQALASQQQTSGHLNGGFNRAPGGGLANGGPIQPSPMASSQPRPNFAGGLPQAPQAPMARLPQPFQPGQSAPQMPQHFPFTGPQRPQMGQGGQGFPPQTQAGPQGPQAPQIPEVGTGNVPGFSLPESQPQAPLGGQQLSPEIQQLLQQFASQGVPGQQSPGVPQQPHHNRFSALMRAILPGV